jgi:hypothetical protein
MTPLMVSLSVPTPEIQLKSSIKADSNINAALPENLTIINNATPTTANITVAAMEHGVVLPATSSAQPVADDPIIVANAANGNNKFNAIVPTAPVPTETTNVLAHFSGTVLPPKHVATKTKLMPRMKQESKMVFLDDPDQTVPSSINCSDISSLSPGNYLYTRLVDYLIQRSIIMKDHDSTVIASSLSLPLM